MGWGEATGADRIRVILRPVDSHGGENHVSGMKKKKPTKAEEPASAYQPARRAGAKGPKAGRADESAFQKSLDKIFAERKELLHKLAQ
jgi:hypothetical protein